MSKPDNQVIAKKARNPEKKENKDMKIEFEYGQGTMPAELPDNTDIFIPGETVKDPDYIPEDKLEEAYLESLAHPTGMPTLTELAHKGSTVTFIVPDRVKGGEQATSHRKLSIKYILRELYAAGVEKKDILFIISNGLHPRSKDLHVNLSPLVKVKGHQGRSFKAQRGG